MTIEEGSQTCSVTGLEDTEKGSQAKERGQLLEARQTK